MKQFNNLSNNKLKKTNGGIAPLAWGAIGLFVLQDAWSHTDQIWAGMKKGFYGK